MSKIYGRQEALNPKQRFLLVTLGHDQRDPGRLQQAVMQKVVEQEDAEQRWGLAEPSSTGLQTAREMAKIIRLFQQCQEMIHRAKDPGWSEYVDRIAQEIDAVARAAGFERIDQTNVPFNGKYHRSVKQMGTPDGRPVVAELLAPGYLLGSQTLIEALVAIRYEQ